VNSFRQANRRPVALLQTLRAVAWSFLGIRRASGLDEDVQTLSPLHVVLGGLIGAALFVVAIFILVRWVVSSGVAA